MPNVISVIVPVYKVEAYLDKCVQSLVDQTYEHLEIILVDDGSPDRCGEMCEAWAQKDARICVIHKENGGLSDARNAGMAVSTGEYIAFVDSDDWVAADFLEKLYAALQRDNSDIAACGVQMIWENSEAPVRLLTDGFIGVLDREEAQAALLEESHLKQPVWYKLYRRCVVQGIPFEVGKYHEDAFWSYQAIGRAQRVSVIADIGYYYLQRGGSIMGTSYSLKRLDSLEAVVKRQQYFKEQFPQLLDYACISVAGSLMYHGQQACLHLKKDERKQAFQRLRDVQKQFPLKGLLKQPIKRTHKLWLACGNVSLRITCYMRNLLKIGL